MTFYFKYPVNNQEVIDIFFEKCKPFGKPLVICEVGSRAYGLSTPESDFDVRGCFLPNVEYLIGLKKVEQIQIKQEDWVCQALVHFCHIVAKQNPTILELLYIEDPIYHHKLWLDLKPALKQLVCRKAFRCYNAYVQSQIKKLNTRQPIGKRAELVEKYGMDVKFCGHAARLSVQCKYLMQTGAIPVKVPEPYRTEIMDIKAGKISKEEAIKYIESLDKECYEAYKNSKLPEDHDVEAFQNNTLIPLLSNHIELQNKYGNEN